MIGARDIPSDDTLPQLSKALDASTMSEKFQDLLFESEQLRHRFRVTDCEIVYVKYKQTKPCTVCYQLSIHDTGTQQVFAQLYSAQIFQPGDSWSRYTQARAQSLISQTCGKALIHIPEWDMVIWCFPNDRKLTALPELTDPAHLRNQWLPKLLTHTFRGDWAILLVSPEVMNYLPRYSCTVKVMLHLHSRELAKKKSMTLYAKTYADKHHGDHAYAVMSDLWKTEARKLGEFRMAQPIWYDCAKKVLWQLAVPGTTLQQYNMKSPHFTKLVEDAGRTVAILHSLSVQGARPIILEDRLAKLEHFKPSLSGLKPHTIKTLDNIVAFHKNNVTRFEQDDAVTLHGDLHFKNFVVDGTSVSIIDLDDIGIGSPLHDLGSFVSYLLYQGLEVGLTESRMEELIKVFLQSYQRQVNWEVSEPALRWYVATALVIERVYRCLKKAKPGTFVQIERIVKLIDRLTSDSQYLSVGGPLVPASERSL